MDVGDGVVTRIERAMLAFMCAIVAATFAFLMYIEYLNVTHPMSTAPSCAEDKRP